MNTCDFLDAVKSSYGLASDYQLAKKLSVTTSTIGNYRSKRSFLSDDMALKVAHLLEVDPLIILACVNAERNLKSGSAEVFDFWANLAEKQIKNSAILSVA